MDCKIGDQEKQKILLQIKLMDNLEKDYTYWKCVLWSDETKLELWPERANVRRQKGEEYHPKNTLPTVKQGGGSILLLQCIWNWEFQFQFLQVGRNNM